MTNGQKLKQWLDDMGYKSKWLSMRLFCTSQTISTYLSGKVAPPPRKAWKIEELTDGHVKATEWKGKDDA